MTNLDLNKLYAMSGCPAPEMSGEPCTSCPHTHPDLQAAIKTQSDFTTLITAAVLAFGTYHMVKHHGYKLPWLEKYLPKSLTRSNPRTRKNAQLFSGQAKVAGRVRQLPRFSASGFHAATEKAHSLLKKAYPGKPIERLHIVAA